METTLVFIYRKSKYVVINDDEDQYQETLNYNGTVRIFLNRTSVKDDPEILNTSIETATEANLALTLYQ